LQSGSIRVGIKPNIDFLQRGRKSVELLFDIMNGLYQSNNSLMDTLGVISEYYRPLLKEKHDDWQKRWKDIEMFLSISQRYNSLEHLVHEISLDPPVAIASELLEEGGETEHLTLSTIHSAKGLEWDSVFLITALEGRFPSSKAEGSLEQLEEERRLMYVALTRAKNRLYVSYPTNIFDRESGQVLAYPSRFIDGISEEILERFVLAEDEVHEEFPELPPPDRKNLLN
ncbi:MAG: ATP-dependent helicase, partial [Candidatus Kapabacteria bacterium]|nr:ATP-dependent helicase [Candidatus Kapabacteria bacterium]